MSSNRVAARPLGPSVAAALLLAVALVASPLLVCAVIAAPLCVWRLARGLPPEERRMFIGLLSGALVMRAVLVAAQMLLGLPNLNDMSVGALAGDEGYYLSRALRVRDLLFGYAATTYDHFVANDSYGQTSYLSLLTGLQMVFGPTPYSMKVVNGLLYVCGAGLLFRISRASFGVLPSYVGLTIVLFLPSLFFSSVSLLKESSYFLATCVFITCCWRGVIEVQDRRLLRAALLMAAAAVSLLALDGLRRGGLMLMAGGFMTGMLIWLVGQSRARIAAAAAATAIAVVAVAAVPAAHDRAVAAIESAAKVQGGHVFTIGHVYKLLDDRFYAAPRTPAGWDLQLTDAEAARFVARAAASFVLIPLPWQVRSTSEVAFLPEQVTWYLMMAALPFGIAAGWRASPLGTALFLGFAIPTAVVVALTNGNVGTLLRLRGLATPYFAWISAVGLCAIGERLASAAAAGSARLKERPAL